MKVGAVKTLLHLMAQMTFMAFMAFMGRRRRSHQ